VTEAGFSTRPSISPAHSRQRADMTVRSCRGVDSSASLAIALSRRCKAPAIERSKDVSRVPTLVRFAGQSSALFWWRLAKSFLRGICSCPLVVQTVLSNRESRSGQSVATASGPPGNEIGTTHIVCVAPKCYSESHYKNPVAQSLRYLRRGCVFVGFRPHSNERS
jgi:hypothetical protein